MSFGDRLAPRVATVCALALAILATGCKKEIIHQLTENEANEVLVVLKSANIEADKEPDVGEKKGLAFKITVEETLAVDAMRVLLDNQLPRIVQPGLADTFKTPSMIPTETEEKARFLNAMQGDLSNSLENIDGVVDARVHLVLPEANPFGDTTVPARASILIKYRERQRPQDAEQDLKKREEQWRSMVMGMNDDLKRLRTIWTKDLPTLLNDDDRQLVTLDTYLSEKRGEDSEAKDARIALGKLKKSAMDRRGLQNALASLPKFKDIDTLISKSEAVEIESVGFPSATVRSLVARATPKLLEDDVAVEFTKVVAKPPPAKVPDSLANIAKNKVDKNLFIAAAGAAAVLALGLIGLAVWIMGLKGKLASAEARARAVASPPSSVGG